MVYDPVSSSYTSKSGIASQFNSAAGPVSSVNSIYSTSPLSPVYSSSSITTSGSSARLPPIHSNSPSSTHSKSTASVSSSTAENRFSRYDKPLHLRSRSKSPITNSIISQSLPRALVLNSPSRSGESTGDVKKPFVATAKSFEEASVKSAPSSLGRPNREKRDGSDALVSPSLLKYPRANTPPAITSPPVVKSAVLVFEKPLVGTENTSPFASRSTFRKSQDIGDTCFLASKREKKDEDSGSEILQRFNKHKLKGATSKHSVNTETKELSSKSWDGGINDVLAECQGYLNTNGECTTNSLRRLPKMESSVDVDNNTSAPLKNVDTGQKNGNGGFEGYGEKNRRLFHQKEVKKENRVNFGIVDFRRDDNDIDDEIEAAIPSESPDVSAIKQEEAVLAIAEELTECRNFSVRQQRSWDGDSRDYAAYKRVRSPEPHSILKRPSSRDDSFSLSDRAVTPEPHGILKRRGSSRGSSSRASSVDTLDGDLVPILKKKSSTEELDRFEPKPILKKKASTDDELDDRPKSILKSAISREEIHSSFENGGVVSPTPSILKRSSGRSDSDGEELRRTGILKRRDRSYEEIRARKLHLSDGEEVMSARHRSDSVPLSAMCRSSSPLFSHSTHASPKKRSHTPPHRPSILKNRYSMSPINNTVSLHNSPDGDAEELCFKPRRLMNNSSSSSDKYLGNNDDDDDEYYTASTGDNSDGVRYRKTSADNTTSYNNIDRVRISAEHLPASSNERGDEAPLPSAAARPSSADVSGGARPKVRAASFSTRTRRDDDSGPRRSSWVADE